MTTPSAPRRQQLRTHDLWSSVDRLTRDRTQRLVRQLAPGKHTVEKIPIPSLLTQLREALGASDTGGDQRSRSTGSRAPLDLAIEALLADMSKRLRAGLAARGHRPRVLIGAIDRLRHDVQGDLRQFATVLVGTNDQALVDHWTTEYHLWVAQAETILTGDDEAIDLRGIRGHACPACGATFIERVEPSNDPRAIGGYERFRDAVLVIAFRDGQVQHITCRACDTGWWRGDDVDELSLQIRATTTPDIPRREEQRPDYGDINAGGLLSGWTDDWWPLRHTDPRRMGA